MYSFAYRANWYSGCPLEEINQSKNVDPNICNPYHGTSLRAYHGICASMRLIKLPASPMPLQVKEIVELLDQSAKAIRSGAAGSTRVQGGVVVPSIKVIRRQTVMVSATLEKGVSRLAAVLLSK